MVRERTLKLAYVINNKKMGLMDIFCQINLNPFFKEILKTQI